MADPGEGLGGPGAPRLFLDQNENKFSEAGPLLISGSGWPPHPPPPPLSEGLDPPLRVSLILQWVSDFLLAKMSKWSHFKL